MELDTKDYENLVIDGADVQKIVLAYLVHNCFKETADAFVSSTDIKFNADSDWSAELDKRKLVYNCTMEGNALRAIELATQLAPGIFQNDKDVLFDLLTLHFVELVRVKNCTGALDFAQRELTEYGKIDKYIDKLQDCMTLLAYEEPEKSPVFELLSMDYRESVADKLNQSLLAYHKHSSHSSLERLLQQLTVVRGCLSKEGGKVNSSKKLYACRRISNSL